MTARWPRARGLIDSRTGEALALTYQGVFRVTVAGATFDVTPPFSWMCAALGGGAIALAGPDELHWHGAPGLGASTALPAGGISRLIVLGERVASVSGAGRLTVWDRMGAELTSPTGRAVELDLEPDGLAFDADGSRILAWGWDGAGDPAMAVVELGDGRATVVRPETPWPAADTGVAPLTGGRLAVGGVDRVVVVSPTGEPLDEIALPGLERVGGSGSAVGWFRNRGGDEIVVGLGHVGAADGSLTVDAELPISSVDPFPEFAVVGESVVVAVGAGPRDLAMHRMTAAGWEPAVTVELPDRPAMHAEAAPIND